jgi:hypothetical protein
MAGLQLPNRAALAARAGMVVAAAVAAAKSARRSVLVCIFEVGGGKSEGSRASRLLLKMYS